MAGLENLKTRLNYVGGGNQQKRMNSDKVKTLKKALLYSYQAATAILADGREFRCLINPDRLKNEYDNKIISIPFEDICLGKVIKQLDEETGEVFQKEEVNFSKNKTNEDIEEIGIKAGDVFTWKENNTDWIVYLQRLEETAYFRAEIRRCRYEVEINKNSYKVYACGPSEDKLDWRKVHETVYNTLNYTLEMYITKNEETEAFFHRFSKIKLNGKPWEVQAVDNMSLDGIIVVALKEDFSNTLGEAIEKEKNEKIITPEETDIYIDGETTIYPYDEKEYKIIGTEDGIWSVDNKKIQIINQDSEKVKIFANTGRSGNFVLIYKREDADDITLSVTIESL